MASTLSFIAGIVNITGVLSVKVLTTNVTGHFAYFSEELVKKNYVTALVFLVYIFCFLAGAFISNLLIETVIRIKPAVAHTIPMFIEILILTIIGMVGSSSLTGIQGQVIACALLFAMGLQNSLVTKVSQSVVRTTHLTGLFTDLGIELSQLFFYRQQAEFRRLSKSIYLKLAIISFFFTGGVLGGFIFKTYALKTLFLASGCLILALYYDNIIYHYYHLKRKAR
ncbi:YoaK family protein [Chitinophaga oryziterrae]